MPFPFGKSQKSPAEIVKTLRENVAHLEKLDAGDSKKFEKVSGAASPGVEDDGVGIHVGLPASAETRR